jgi:hypothetical protein
VFPVLFRHVPFFNKYILQPIFQSLRQATYIDTYIDNEPFSQLWPLIGIEVQIMM